MGWSSQQLASYNPKELKSIQANPKVQEYKTMGKRQKGMRHAGCSIRESIYLFIPAKQCIATISRL